MNQRKRKRAPRRKQTPDFPIRIDRLSHEGRGLVQWGERILFVDGALPGELVTVRITQKSSRTAEGIAKAVLVPSPERVVSQHVDMLRFVVVAHFSIFPIQRSSFTNRKTLDELMTREGILLDRVAKLPTLQGPILGYRRRARLRPLGAFKRSRIDWLSRERLEFHRRY